MLRKISGFYHDNYIIPNGDEPFVVGVPLGRANTARVIPEDEVLMFLEAVNFPAPRLLYSDPDSKFAVHSFISGDVFNHVYFRNIRVPDWALVQIANLIKRLHHLETAQFAQYRDRIAKSATAKEFFQFVLNHSKAIFSLLREQYESLYKTLLFPVDPFLTVEVESENLSDRDFVLCHGDIHRSNLLIEEQTRSLVLIDWETCLIGDPAYDLAVHLQKMRYEPDQENLFLQEYLKDNVPLNNAAEWQSQIEIYRKLEQLTLVIIDTPRYLDDLNAKHSTEEEHHDYASRYFAKLQTAWRIWGIETNVMTIEDIKQIFLSAV